MTDSFRVDPVDDPAGGEDENHKILVLDTRRGTGVTGEGATSVREEATAALETLSEAIEANRTDGEVLIDWITALRVVLDRGRSTTAAAESEALGETVRLVSRMFDRSAASSGKARRSLARVMRADGASVLEIARTFGVSHQRISNILR